MPVVVYFQTTFYSDVSVAISNWIVFVPFMNRPGKNFIISVTSIHWKQFYQIKKFFHIFVLHARLIAYVQHIRANVAIGVPTRGSTPLSPMPPNLSTQILDHYIVDLCYKCQNRKFNMDVETVSLTEKFEGQKRYRHFSHRHAVEFSQQNEEYGQVNCSACGKLCSARTYGCVTCQILLHQSCFDLPLQIRHFFHPCPLTLCIQPNCFNCGACDRAILQSFYFYCKWCNFAMDIECALLPTVKAQSGEQFCHFTHGHPLTLTEIKDEDEISCSTCGRCCSGPAYDCSKCSFILDKSCFELPREIQHNFHPSHPLTLLTQLCELE